MVHVVKKQRILAPGPQQVDSPNRVPSSGETAKNLRWTSVALCEKMRREKTGISSQVADEVAAEAAAQVKEVHPEREVSHVERNTRRRVYDALKVLVAIGCIDRDTKSLQWIGVDHVRNLWMDDVPTEAEYAAMGLSRSYPGIGGNRKGEDVVKSDNEEEKRQRHMENRNMRIRIGAKKTIAKRLAKQISTYEAVRKRKREQNAPVDKNMQSIGFPMLVIKGKPEAIKVANKYHRVTTLHKAKPRVYTEADIVNLMCESDPSLLNDLHQSKRVKIDSSSRKDYAANREARDRHLLTPPPKKRQSKRGRKARKPLIKDEPTIMDDPNSGPAEEESMMDDRVIKSEDLGLSHLSDQLHTDSESGSTSSDGSK